MPVAVITSVSNSLESALDEFNGLFIMELAGTTARIACKKSLKIIRP